MVGAKKAELLDLACNAMVHLEFSGRAAFGQIKTLETTPKALEKVDIKFIGVGDYWYGTQLKKPLVCNLLPQKLIHH